MPVPYPPDLTMRAARALYFENNGFGADGGYGAAWVDFKLGPLPFPFPNTPQRIDAVKFHDLHHVLTGYDTDFPGELEISAWEIAAGCKGYAAAWVLNLGGMAAGLFTCPVRVLDAFARGRRSRTLYGESFDPLLEQTVGALRADHVAEGSPRPSVADALRFALACVAGLAVGLTLFALVVPLVPVGLVMSWLRRRAAARGVTA
ncbi:hypothetical protein BH11MYX4_BH11MYX4_69200 [soil metagenome]